MPVSVRTRFEIFKRDDFACAYCGRKSPEVVLEVDHIVPVCDGGADDPINLTTACWECNRGKSGEPLGKVMTGEDPHDAAVLMLERERQLREYNAVLAADRERRDCEAWELIVFWCDERGVKPDENGNYRASNQDYYWLMNTLKWCPKEVIREFMGAAVSRRMTRDMRWVGACVRNWRAEHGLDPITEEMGTGYARRSA